MNDQRSLTDQLKDLIQLANQHGLYDAADYVTEQLQRASLFDLPEVDPEEVEHSQACIEKEHDHCRGECCHCTCHEGE